MSTTETDSITLHRVSPSTAETAEYEGEYTGIRVRVTRLTDPNADGGVPETRWDGFLWDSGHEMWTLIAECHASRRSATLEVKRWIDRQAQPVTAARPTMPVADLFTLADEFKAQAKKLETPTESF